MVQFFKHLILLISALAATVFFSSSASSLEKPSTPVLLEISGNITQSNSDGSKALIDRSLLTSLPRTKIDTMTPWTDGRTVFEGVLVRDLLDLVGADGKTVQAIAINDYMVEIPMEDFVKYDVIVADHKNGDTMSIRDKGPLWIIYPWNTNPELVNEVYHSRSIWQLRKLVIK
ncbi:MAG: hypothetical protein ACJAYR_001325 [Sneathiella sp.]|jgi:hypothetical protein